VRSQLSTTAGINAMNLGLLGLVGQTANPATYGNPVVLKVVRPDSGGLSLSLVDSIVAVVFVLIVVVLVLVLARVLPSHGVAEKKRRMIKRWRTLPTLATYTRRYPDCLTERGIQCVRCKSHSIHEWGMTIPSDKRRKFVCSSCGKRLYRSEERDADFYLSSFKKKTQLSSLKLKTPQGAHGEARHRGGVGTFFADWG